MRKMLGKFTIANISYFSEFVIRLGKILANDISFAKFATKFPPAKILRYTTLAYWQDFTALVIAINAILII